MKTPTMLLLEDALRVSCEAMREHVNEVQKSGFGSSTQDHLKNMGNMYKLISDIEDYYISFEKLSSVLSSQKQVEP